MMKFASVVLMVCVVLSGCSSSVRPLHPGNQVVAGDMLRKAESLGLSLSETGTRTLARALTQGEAYCATSGEVLHSAVLVNDQKDPAVPVVQLQCVAAGEAAVPSAATH